MNSNKTPLTKMLLMNFHEAALWGAITLTKRFNPDLAVREIIRAYKEELDLSDYNLPETLGWVVYSRINTKINRARNELNQSDHKFKGELVEDIEHMKKQLDELVKAIKEQ